MNEPQRPDNEWLLKRKKWPGPPWTKGEIIMTGIAVILFLLLMTVCVYQVYKMWEILYG